MDNELLVSMFVDGAYQYYVPMFCLFAQEAYPEHDIAITFMDVIEGSVEEQLNFCDCNRLYIKTEVGTMPTKFARWKIIHKGYERYKAVYIGDIDILIMRDKPTLLEKHLAICEKQNLPFSNTCGIDDPRTRGNRVTGIHFFQNDERQYLEKMKNAREDFYFDDQYFNPKLGRNDNQHALYCLLKDCGFEIPNHKEFYYDGLHLGHSRVLGRWDELLKTNQPDANYPLFYQQFKEIAKTNIYKDFYNQLPKFIKDEIDIMTAAMWRAYES
jgi:hypothetical protein